MDNNSLAMPTARAGHEPSQQVVSAVPVTIPIAWRRTMQMDWSTDTGVVTLTYPGDMSEQDTVDLKQLFDVAFTGMVRRAQAIEARRAETGTGSVHESAVGETDAPEQGSHTTEQRPEGKE